MRGRHRPCNPAPGDRERQCVSLMGPPGNNATTVDSLRAFTAHPIARCCEDLGCREGAGTHLKSAQCASFPHGQDKRNSGSENSFCWPLVRCGVGSVGAAALQYQNEGAHFGAESGASRFSRWPPASAPGLPSACGAVPWPRRLANPGRDLAGNGGKDVFPARGKGKVRERGRQGHRPRAAGPRKGGKNCGETRGN